MTQYVVEFLLTYRDNLPKSFSEEILHESFKAQGFRILNEFTYITYMDSVRTILAVQNITKELPWFANSLEDIKLLRVTEVASLMDALE